jgi:hypothetical protein
MHKFIARFSPLITLGLTLAGTVSLGLSTAIAADTEKVDIQEAMSPEQFRAAGLQKLSPDELAHLNSWLKGYREQAANKAVSHEKLQLIVSRINGVFSVVESRQIIRLEDGSAWKVSQTDTHHYPSVDHPPVAVFKTVFGWKMRVGGIGEFYVVRVGNH